MKNLILAVAALVTIPSVAQAERMILKNPKGPIVAKVVQTIEFGRDKFVVVEAPRVNGLMASLARSSESASMDYEIRLPVDETQPSDSNSAQRAWHPDALRYSQLPASRDGSNVVVAVLDTGTDYNHPALKDHVFTNSAEVAGNGVDDDGNGFIDDVHGYDFDEKDGDPMDGDAHGTHCSGIIGASKNASSNAQGVAPGVKIMPVRIIGSEQRGFLSNAAAGIKYAVDNGAKVLSNSWRVYQSWSSFDPSDTNIAMLRAAIEYAGQHGAIVVAASGNESLDMDTGFASDPLFPAGFTGLDNFVVVAASERNGGMASFSNYGANYVTVAAPGDDIISTVPGGSWETMSGTSMACPLVAGSIARGLSAGMDMHGAIDKLIRTSQPNARWTNKVKGGGVIDLYRYLAE